MTPRIPLDACSFQKLLAAAWTLQCERDRQQSELNSAPVPCRESSDRAESATLVSASAVQVREAVATILEAQTLPVGPPGDRIAPPSNSLPAPLRHQTEISGAMALADDPLSLFPAVQPPVVQNPIPFPSFPRKKFVSVQNPTATLESPRGIVLHPGPGGAKRERKKASGRAHRVRAKLYPVAVGLVFLLGLFTLLQFRSHPRSPSSVEAAVRVPTPTVAAPTMETSHLRATDAAASSAIEDLSRFEVQNLRRQARYGDDAAALTLGMAYETGMGVPQNCKEAAHWMAVAAENGNPAAQYNLGLRYLSGDGVSVSRDKGREWLQKSASRGYKKAEAALSLSAPSDAANAAE